MRTMPISTHLHHKPWQIAITDDPTLPVRKWNHLGTVWSVSSLSAAYHVAAYKGLRGDAFNHRPVDAESAVYRFGDTFVRVH